MTNLKNLQASLVLVFALYEKSWPENNKKGSTWTAEEVIPVIVVIFGVFSFTKPAEFVAAIPASHMIAT